MWEKVIEIWTDLLGEQLPTDPIVPMTIRNYTCLEKSRTIVAGRSDRSQKDNSSEMETE